MAQTTHRPIPQGTFLDLQDPLETRISVEGTIPAWLSGTFHFVGPSHSDSHKNNGSTRHLFDGFAQLHAISIDKQNIHHATQSIESDAFKHYVKTGKINFNGFGQTYYRSWPKKLFSLLLPNIENDMIPNTTLGITTLQNKLISASHQGFTTHDSQSLILDSVINTQNNYAYQVPYLYADTRDSKLYGVTVEYGAPDENTCVIYTTDPSGKMEVISRVKINLLHYMHTFCVTENYIILPLCPLIAQANTLSLGITSFIQNFSWHPEKNTEFLVIEKKTGKLVNKYVVGSFFALYQANAYEQDGKIILDLATYQNADVFQNYYLNKLNSQQTSAVLTRYTLTENSVVWTEIRSKQTIDYVSIHPEYRGKNYQYVYAAEFNPGHSTRNYNYLSKIDLTKYTVQRWYKPYCYPSEPLFIPAPQQITEDEGVLISLIYNAQENRSFLLVLNAQDMKEIAKINFSHALPHPLRGIYIAG